MFFPWSKRRYARDIGGQRSPLHRPQQWDSTTMFALAVLCCLIIFAGVPPGHLVGVSAVHTANCSVVVMHLNGPFFLCNCVLVQIFGEFFLLLLFNNAAYGHFLISYPSGPSPHVFTTWCTHLCDFAFLFLSFSERVLKSSNAFQTFLTLCCWHVCCGNSEDMK